MRTHREITDDIAKQTALIYTPAALANDGTQADARRKLKAAGRKLVAAMNRLYPKAKLTALVEAQLPRIELASERMFVAGMSTATGKSQKELRKLERSIEKYEDIPPDEFDGFDEPIEDVVIGASIRAGLNIDTETTDQRFTKDGRALMSSLWEEQAEKTVGDLVEGIAADAIAFALVSLLRGPESRVAKTRRRGDNIAMNETQVYASNQHRGRQLKAGIRSYFWTSQGDDEVRPFHDELDGQVFPLKGPGPDEGQHPGEPNLCFPGSTKLNGFPRVEKAFRRRHAGELTEIVCDDGVVLSSTPNHPILTTHGLVAAHLIRVGDHVIGEPHESFDGIEGHGECSDITIEQVFRALGSVGVSGTVPADVGRDFHGDATYEEVDIVWTDWSLIDKINSAAVQVCRELGLSEADEVRARRFMSGGGGFGEPLGRRGDAEGCGMRSLHLVLSLLRAHLTPLQCFGFALAADMPTANDEVSPDDGPGDPKMFSDRVLAFARFIHGHDFFDREIDAQRCGAPLLPVRLHASRSEMIREGARVPAEPDRDTVQAHSRLKKVRRVVEKRTRVFDGHVYNLQTSTGMYVAQSVSVSNCRCFQTPSPLTEIVRLYSGAHAELFKQLQGRRLLTAGFSDDPLSV